MAFSPKAVHEGIDKFYLRAAIEFRGEQSDEFFEGLLKEGIVIAGLVARMRII